MLDSSIVQVQNQQILLKNVDKNTLPLLLILMIKGLKEFISFMLKLFCENDDLVA